MIALAAGMPGRALRKLSHEGTIQKTVETLAKLQALHPQSPEPAPCSNLAKPPQLTHSAMAKALRNMRQSASGPSGLRADRVLLALTTGSSESLLGVLMTSLKGKHQSGFETLN